MHWTLEETMSEQMKRGRTEGSTGRCPQCNALQLGCTLGSCGGLNTHKSVSEGGAPTWASASHASTVRPG